MQRGLIAIGVLFAALGAGYALPVREMFVQTQEPAKAPRATVLFGGDMMFDRSIRQYAARHGGDYLFGCIDATLQGADLVVANLEGPITKEPSVSLGTAPGSTDNYTFTFPTTTAALLKRHRIDLVNIGNNHILNFGRSGLAQTKTALAEAGVQYFGDPDAVESERVARLSVNGIELSFVNWSDWTSDKTDHAVAQVRAEAKRGRVPVVYTHWGIEYATTAPAHVVALAHQFVDAGAAAVIGSHPHVVEQSEVYKGAPIYYSLGNFIFDQYFSSEVTRGLLVELAFSTSSASVVREVPIVLSRDRRVCPAAVE